MSQIDVNQLLGQMRAMSGQAGGATLAVQPTAGKSDFSALLARSIDSVSATQQHAGGLATAFEQGDSGADLGKVMVAMQKADLSFKAMTQVRNKLVDAYKEVMNMSI